MPTKPKPKSKPTFALTNQIPTVEWPPITSEDQNAILELLCHVLSPIGAHRVPSKGKRKRTRKRKRATTIDTTQPPPPPPALGEYLTIGLNSTTQSLERLAAERIPSAFPPPTTALTAATETKRICVVFVCRADSQASQLHAHLPVLCGLAGVRLVQLPRGAEARVAAALGVARAGFVGVVKGAPDVGGLVGFVEGVVEPVRVGWLGGAEYWATNIKVGNMGTVEEGKGKVSGSG